MKKSTDNENKNKRTMGNKKAISNSDKQGLRTPPQRWISAQLLYIWVSAQQWSWRCSQNLHSPFLWAV